MTAAEAQTIGVLGGMGPTATIDFMRMVIELTAADRDQDHIPMVVHHNPRVPNRQDAMFLDGQDPGPVIGEMGRRLEAAGADFLVMPCNSAHSFVNELAKKTSVPFVSIVLATADASARFRRVAVMATDGCLASGLYQDALTRRGVEVIVPTDRQLADLMTLIARVKAGDTGSLVKSSMQRIAGELLAAGAEAVIAGCTEIPLVLDSDTLGAPVLSSTEELARVAVDMALGRTPG